MYLLQSPFTRVGCWFNTALNSRKVINALSPTASCQTIWVKFSSWSSSNPILSSLQPSSRTLYSSDSVNDPSPRKITEICKSEWKIRFALLCYLEYTKAILWSLITFFIFIIIPFSSYTPNRNSIAASTSFPSFPNFLKSSVYSSMSTHPSEFVSHTLKAPSMKNF